MGSVVQGRTIPFRVKCIFVGGKKSIFFNILSTLSNLHQGGQQVVNKLSKHTSLQVNLICLTVIHSLLDTDLNWLLVNFSLTLHTG